MSGIRWGVYGTGVIADDFLKATRSSLPDSGKKFEGVVQGVAARGIEKAKAFAALHKIPDVHSSFEALCAAENIDVVYISSPNALHYSQCLIAIGEGKHVLCEKTFCLTAKQGKHLIEEAKKKNVFLLEANWMCFFPYMDQLRETLSSGTLGQVQLVEANLGFLTDPEFRQHLTRHELGGGALGAVGVYPLTLSQIVHGNAKPSKIQACGVVDESKTDVQVSVQLCYPSGGVSLLHSSLLTNSSCAARIDGTKASLMLHGDPHFISCTRTELLFPDAGGAEGSVTENRYPLPVSSESFGLPNSAGLLYEILEVERCIAAGMKESPLWTHQQTLTNLEIIDEIRQQIGVVFETD
uniref:D-xylose 1-dehydrogenase (NADP(+), D-xylono-1,5-lactone-forming) n=1 Tax=Chromera velia CCMP2878 TaxID=1169474 RepID=A0A0G4FN48_9ALVE|eukprot:Cvel_17686.t1-p1 / transcript=Cvel_17686.t1 / gene=Cvel_17686 / organism=Chromera_velia_CCMP2878 / gene_product=Trans-1,2-dihydrobenzene-1,2-diol dehydrogenase, putative / transcript_product=Trans-1,2-dihydrobenzene-1,2-diol dehydrogenase, putative / location=Cvel_scaffold1427:778-2060(+) / protein_length=352 / sequence_SO=supercontig / SO=protein_coding / is_pseudo=false